MLSKFSRIKHKNVLNEVMVDSIDSIFNSTSFPVDINSIDFSYIDWSHLARFDKNINKKRDKEWLESSHLDEIRDFEDEFLFDKTLTFKEKSILLKSKVNLEPFCKYCNKEFKAVGKFLFNHEVVCPFNLKWLNLSTFLALSLRS